MFFLEPNLAVKKRTHSRRSFGAKNSEITSSAPSTDNPDFLSRCGLHGKLSAHHSIKYYYRFAIMNRNIISKNTCVYHLYVLQHNSRQKMPIPKIANKCCQLCNHRLRDVDMKRAHVNIFQPKHFLQPIPLERKLR